MFQTDLLTWVWRTKPNYHNIKLRLFCLPYGGGGASMYSGWMESFPPSIEVCPIRLPGRETRFSETPYTRLEPLVSKLSKVIAPLCDRPFAIFGYSLGALIGFELARGLERYNGKVPSRLIAAASCAPQLLPSRRRISHLSKDEFLQEVIRLNGIPKQVLLNNEMLDLCLPVIRADFAIGENYTFREGPRLSCPITVFGGLHDPMYSYSDLAAWQYVTSQLVQVQTFPADHFFFNTCYSEVLSSTILATS